VRNEETGEYHLYITNVPAEKLSAEDVARNYAVRWLIEMAFKQLKSAYRIDQKRDAGDVIQVRVRHEDVIDFLQIGERQISHAGAGVDQHIVVQKHGGRAQLPADTSAATEYSEPHGVIWYRRRWRRPSRAPAN